MKHSAQHAPPPAAGRKQASHLADAQIAHLERAVASWLGQASLLADRGLNLAYWKMRVEAIEKQFDLLLSQRTRVKALRHAMKARSSTVETMA
jgi:hypothetical protein